MYPAINPELVHNLEKLGFSENEGKAYAGLVSLKEATAREVHELTGVPRAKVYDILKTLSKKGFVEVRQGSPVYFQAVDPKHVIGRIKDEFFTCAIVALDQLNELSYDTGFLRSGASRANGVSGTGSVRSSVMSGMN